MFLFKGYFQFQLWPRSYRICLTSVGFPARSTNFSFIHSFIHSFILTYSSDDLSRCDEEDILDISMVYDVTFVFGLFQADVSLTVVIVVKYG